MNGNGQIKANGGPQITQITQMIPNDPDPFGLARAILIAASKCLIDPDGLPCAVVVKIRMVGDAQRICEAVLDDTCGVRMDITPDQWHGSKKAVLLFSRERHA